MRDRLKIDRALDGWARHYRFSGYVHHMHRHTELEINLVTRGKATYLMSDRRRIDLRRGTLIWLFPEQDHLLVNQSDDYEMWVVVFRPAMVRRWTRRRADTHVLSQPNPAGRFSRQLLSADAVRLKSLLEELAGAMADSDAPRFNAGLAYALLSAWRAFVEAGESPDTATGTVHPAVEAAARIVRDETQASGIDVLARRCDISASRLSRLFKLQTGVALVNYRQKICLERFLDLYRADAKMNMMQAALDAGFGSYPQFHRVFKQYMNRSPADYRREIDQRSRA